MHVTVTDFRTETGPTNACMFHATVGRRPTRIYWNGPGARLKLVWGDQLTSIDHPTADMAHDDRASARRAAAAFMLVLAECTDTA